VHNLLTGISVVKVFYSQKRCKNKKNVKNAFLAPRADTQFQGGAKYTGWEKLPIFDWNRRLSRKRCEIGQWLLWNVNRKSRGGSMRVDYNDLEWPLTPISRSRPFSMSNISKRSVLETKLLSNTSRKAYPVYRMVPLSMTLRDLWPRF